ncbi:hypothetical protein ABI59_07575 [Acidobacteria bacterium Mor1]|nr:hypothetical protein ABI59_07575 [Acidobacteria bacterium Mor1]
MFDDDSFGLSLAWKQGLGRGYSSVLAVSDRVIATYGDGEANWLVAMDAAGGRRLWSYRTSDYYPAHTGSEGGPSSTPTIDGGTVFGVSRYGKLFALDLADGKERWARQLEDGPLSRTPHYGWTTSPVIVGDLVVLLTGGDAGHSITAFDRRSGEPRWHTGEGSVSYQTPAIRTIGGREQLVAVNDQKIMGLNPESGEILWEHEHGTYIVEAFAQPVTIGENQLLINSLQEVVAYRIDREGDSYTVEEMWRNRNLRSSYAVPVVHEGSVFGLSRNILVCLDAASGEVRWKSREPGARGLILVDGHLLILDRNGAVVVVEAAGDAYRERARQAVFERYGHVAPSFANGRIYVRNDDEIAALDVVDSSSGGDDGRPDRELLGQFGKWVGRTEQTEDPQAAVNAYLEQQETLPVIEGNLVHFLYQAQDEAVAISGTFLEWWDPVPMHRVAGTDLFFRSMKLDPDAVWEYSFHPNFEGRAADPHNPHTIGSASELRMPGWKSPEHIVEKEEGNGRLDSFEFRSDVMDTTQRVQLWLPPGYGRGSDRHGVVYVYNGAGALRVGELNHTLDHIVGSRVAPVIVVFLPWPRALEEYGGGRSPDLNRMLAEELVPHIDRNYRTIPEPASRALAGPAEGGMLALYGALKRPDVFGAAAAQGSSLQVVIADEILQMIAATAASKRPKVFVQWTPNDQKFGEGGIDAVEGSRTLYDAFKKAGYDLHGGERPGSRGWSTWRAYYDDIMEAFFPLGDD